MAEQTLPECGEHQGTCARCGVEIKTAPKRRKFKGEARRKRKTISLRVPDDAGEDGAGLLEDAYTQLETRISGEEKPRPPYYTIMDALSYTLLNAGQEDFGE